MHIFIKKINDENRFISLGKAVAKLVTALDTFDFSYTRNENEFNKLDDIRSNRLCYLGHAIYMNAEYQTDEDVKRFVAPVVVLAVTFAVFAMSFARL